MTTPSPENTNTSATTVHWGAKVVVRDAAPHKPTLKQRLAWFLRKKADKLDDGISLSLQYHTLPMISKEVAVECLHTGFTHSRFLMESMAHQAACEDLMKDRSPELFKEESSQQKR
ncbi:hypothetical protein ACU6TU_09815 [Halomonas sp. LS-001]